MIHFAGILEDMDFFEMLKDLQPPIKDTMVRWNANLLPPFIKTDPLGHETFSKLLKDFSNNQAVLLITGEIRLFHPIWGQNKTPSTSNISNQDRGTGIPEKTLLFFVVQLTKPETQPTSNCLWKGRGSNAERHGWHMAGQRLQFGWTGGLMLRNQYLSQFCII